MTEYGVFRTVNPRVGYLISPQAPNNSIKLSIYINVGAFLLDKFGKTSKNTALAQPTLIMTSFLGVV